jgi:hypothetical protein
MDAYRVYSIELNELAATPGIGDYAKEQEDDPTYDVVAEFASMLSAIDEVVTNISSTLPVDGSGFHLLFKTNPDATLDPRLFTGASLSGLITKLDAVVAAIS